MPSTVSSRRPVYTRSPEDDFETGDLRNLVIIEQVFETQNASGDIVNAWQSFAEVWAAMKPLTGREYFSARQTAATITGRIRIRWLGGITTKMRVRFGQRLFDIQAVLNAEERGVYADLMVLERT